MKALLPYYARQVKCIYIAPPYNTGNENWVYNDAVNSPEIRGPLGLTGVLQLETGPDMSWRQMRFVPMVQLPGNGPAPDPDRAALELIRSLSREDFGSSAARFDEDGEILPPE